LISRAKHRYGSAPEPRIVVADVGPPTFLTSRGETTVAESFPAVGHRYLVDFGSWRTELSFQSDTSLTYTGIRSDGSHGESETVTIKVDPVRDQLFLVSWQESDKTTVVHLEDYRDNRIVTHITGSDGSFSIFHGTMMLIQ
jgi:hypothetical protein